MPKDFVLVALIDVGPHHLELFDDFHGLSDVERQWLEGLVNEYFALLSDLILGYVIQVGKALMQKGSNVLNLLQHLCIITLLNKLDELLKN